MRVGEVTERHPAVTMPNDASKELARAPRLIFSAHVGRMMCNRVFVLAGAALVAVGSASVHAQSQPTEPPPFDPNTPAARAARAKAPPPVAPAARGDAAEPKAPTRSEPAAVPRTAESTPHATSPRPVAPNTPSAGAAHPRRPATAVDPWAEPATAPAPVSRSTTTRPRTIDPWAEAATTPAPVSRSTTRRRAEPAKVIGIDSLGHSSEEPSRERSPTARPQRAAEQGAQAAPAESPDEGLPR